MQCSFLLRDAMHNNAILRSRPPVSVTHLCIVLKRLSPNFSRPGSGDPHHSRFLSPSGAKYAVDVSVALNTEAGKILAFERNGRMPQKQYELLCKIDRKS